jgi:pyruvate dehydrogenase E1 component alpha subunit
LVEHNLATAEELKAIETQVQEGIDAAVKFAEESPEPDPQELYRYIFAED